MAFSKAHKFDDAIYHFSLLCKALSHPARVIILKRLIALHGKRASVAELSLGLPLSKQAFSQHFKILREMSIVTCQENYPHVYYALNQELLNTYISVFFLVTQADAKYNENYKDEIKALGLRRSVGTTPV